MPQRSWGKKRERQYEHIKGGLLERGESEDKAEEIAARTVNKVRAQAGRHDSHRVSLSRTCPPAVEAGSAPTRARADAPSISSMRKLASRMSRGALA